jgi:hypothetical protein
VRNAYRGDLEIIYLRNYRMQYALALKSNYPIGSGVTEATRKTLVTQRMKCAGMRWNINGAKCFNSAQFNTK